MPELAEVELARRIWAKSEGERVSAIETHDSARIYRDLPAPSLKILINECMMSSVRHGKRMYFTFTGGYHLEIHLGMSGKVYLTNLDHSHQKHDHLIIRMETCTLLLNDYRMFGKVMLHKNKPWETLPPDPLSPEFNEHYLSKLLEKKGGKVLKGALLAQELFPGVGNWMADEICWRMGVHPAEKVNALSLEELYKETKFVCEGAIRYVADKNIGKPMENLGFKAGGYVDEVPPPNWLFQHRWKKGGVCPKCKCELERDTIATRTTAWCPKCQPKRA